jgi:putative ABC transport system permease protein
MVEMMSLVDMFWFSYKSLFHNKLRSSLTVLGIVIGIAAIVSLISVTDGLNKSINDMISQFGANNVIIFPGSISSQMGGGAPTGRPMSGRLFEKDLVVLESIPGVDMITAYIYNSQPVIFKNQEIAVSIMGVKPQTYFQLYSDYFELREGRFPRDNDRNVVLLGPDIADDTFDKKISIGQFVYVGNNKKKMRVIGILKKKGGFGAEDNDKAIVAHYSDMKEISKGTLANNEINGIVFSVAEGLNVSEIAETAEYELANAHNLRVEDKDFSVLTSDSILKNFEQITSTLTLFLAFISSISLIVGGVGVTNTMYMSVMERTREIGTLKAIGASDSIVLTLFIIESGLMGLLGGIIGILVGLIVPFIVILAGFDAVITPQLLLFAMGFSFTVGLFSGILPAKRASKLSCIDALRYE